METPVPSVAALRFFEVIEHLRGAIGPHDDSLFDTTSLNINTSVQVFENIFGGQPFIW